MQERARREGRRRTARAARRRDRAARRRSSRSAGVQSSSWRGRAIVDAIAEAARAHDALVVRRRDAGVRLGCPCRPRRSDFLVCRGYKWLLAPRGTAFLTVPPECGRDGAPAARRLVVGARPVRRLLRSAAQARGRRAAARHVAGVVLVGRRGARRWSCSSTSAIEGIGTAQRRPREPLPRRPRARAVELGDRHRRRAGMRPRGSRARGSPRRCAPSRLRVSFHLYNTAADVDAALDALRGLRGTGGCDAWARHTLLSPLCMYAEEHRVRYTTVSRSTAIQPFSGACPTSLLRLSARAGTSSPVVQSAGTTISPPGKSASVGARSGCRRAPSVAFGTAVVGHLAVDEVPVEDAA